MPPLLRIGIRIALAIIIICFIIQPYNWFCHLSQSCRPFYFSYYLPKKEGKKEFDMEFLTTSYREDIKFFAQEAAIKTPTNRKHVVTFHIQNLSKKFISIRPKLIITPKEVEKYLVRYQCPCLQQLKLKGLEEKTLTLEFEIDKKFEDEDYQFFKRTIEHPVKIQLKI